MKKIVARGSWFVKARHYTRKGCDEISQRAAQGSLYRGAGRQRRSERLKVGPYAQGRGPCIFAAGHLQTEACGFASSLPVVVLTVVIGVIPISVVIAACPFLLFIPFVEFVQNQSGSYGGQEGGIVGIELMSALGIF